MRDHPIARGTRALQTYDLKIPTRCAKHIKCSARRPVPFETAPVGHTSTRGPAVRGAQWVLCIIGQLDATAKEPYL